MKTMGRIGFPQILGSPTGVPHDKDCSIWGFELAPISGAPCSSLLKREQPTKNCFTCSILDVQLNRGFWKVSDFGIECDLGFRVALRPVFWGIDGAPGGDGQAKEMEAIYPYFWGELRS